MRIEAKRIRKQAGLTQEEMALVMGLKGRTTYADLELGRAEWKKRHSLLLERVSLCLAVQHRDRTLLAASMSDDLRELTFL